MSSREDPADRASRIAAADRVRIGGEIRMARRSLGRSIESVSHAAGMSSSHGSRIERGEQRSASHEQMARLGAIVGIDVRLKSYPGPDPALDAAQLALISRLGGRLPRNVQLRTEVPLPMPGDQRAWDGVIAGLTGASESRLPFDAETRIVDLQAQHRRLSLKLRDSGFESVMWLIARTRHNREVLDAGRVGLANDFPVSPRRALAALAAGRHPGGSAIILI